MVDALLADEMFISNFSIGWLMAANYGEVDEYLVLNLLPKLLQGEPICSQKLFTNKPFMLS